MSVRRHIRPEALSRFTQIHKEVTLDLVGDGVPVEQVRSAEMRTRLAQRLLGFAGSWRTDTQIKQLAEGITNEISASRVYASVAVLRPADLVCIGSGWPHAHDKKTRLRLVWTQALHWLAFLVAMNLVLLPNVQRMMDAEGLAILTLLALGTFTAGFHILAWQICLVGVIMAVGVPASAWLDRSALLLGLGAFALLGIGLASWLRMRRARQTKQ